MNKSFADRMKRIRESRQYTQKQLAKIINVSEHSISNYEQGICDPSARILLELAQALDVTPEYLLLGGNNMNNYTEAIKTELMQLKDNKQIAHIKALRLNSTVLSHLELCDELVEEIKENWNKKGIFKREKAGVIEESYCTRNYVQEVILRYCQNRSALKEEFNIKDGMLKNEE